MTENSLPAGGHIVEVTVENVDDPEEPVPDPKRLQYFLLRGLDALNVGRVELCVKVAGESLSRKMNHTYRDIDRPTNILSFSGVSPEHLFPINENSNADAFAVRLLGDLLICHPVLVSEARDQGKDLEAHYAHICLHGLLHLLGYNHAQPAEAEEMESKEIEILNSLGFENPYVLKGDSVR